MRRVAGCVAAIMLGALLLFAPAAGALTPAESIAKLNQQRAANGIPAGIVERPDWSDACRKHDAYTKAHGLTHDEDPSQPDYTPEGAWAGQNSVLSTSDGWGPTSVESAWEHAPIHLMQILAPALSEMGTWGGCATTWPGYKRAFGGPTMFSYPGNGTRDHYYEEQAAESPFTPGELVGLPGVTGPHLYFLAGGTDGGQLSSPTLSGPAGPVAVRSVDNTTDRIGDYLPPGGIVIPEKPLDPSTTYTASATFVDRNGVTLPYGFTFSTKAAPPVKVSATLYLSRGKRRGKYVAFSLKVPGALAGRTATRYVTRTKKACRSQARRCRRQRKDGRIQVTRRRLAAQQTVKLKRPRRGGRLKLVIKTTRFQTGRFIYSSGRASRTYRSR